MSGPANINAWERPELQIQNLDELRSKSRKQDLVEQRVEAARLLKASGQTLEQIADTLNRDHSTIVYYLNHYRR